MEEQIFNFTKKHPSFGVRVNHFDNVEFRFSSRDDFNTVIVVSQKQAREIADIINQSLTTKV